MKLTAFFLSMVFLHASASTRAQYVTYEGHEVPMVKVLEAIEHQTRYVFYYDYADLRDAPVVTVSLKQATIEETLKAVLANQFLRYHLEGSTIVLVKKPRAIDSVENLLKPGSIIGVVTGDDGVPLAGATLFIQELKKAGLTNAKGEFIIQGLKSGRYHIDASFVGYDKKSSTVDVDTGVAKVNIMLKRALHNLDETVIKGYYNTTRRLNTGDVSTVTSEEIEKQPVGNILQAIEGRVPGLQISQGVGLPGKYMNVQLRGKNSLAFGTQPLYVIDGMPFFMAPAGMLTFDNDAVSSRGGTSDPFNSINPGDIASVEVLKDADATAIYGSRGANGVILITTKKGKPGKLKVDVDLYSGFAKAIKWFQYLNTPQYLAMRHEAFNNDGLTPGPTDYDLNGTWDTTRYTDWAKYFNGGTAHTTDAQATISGGTAHMQLLISPAYHRETTVLRNGFSDSRGSVHINFNQKSENNRFNAAFSSFLSEDKSYLPADPGYNRLAPDAPAVYNNDGSLNWANSTWRNPASYWRQNGEAVTDMINADLQLSYLLATGLTIKGNFGFNWAEYNQYDIQPQSSFDPAIPRDSRVNFATTTIKGWLVEPQLSYQKHIGKGQLDGLVGMTFHQQKQNGNSFSGTGFISDALILDLGAANAISFNNQSSSLYKYDALLGRIGYSWEDKYLLNMTGRRDGSSRFGPASKFANSGSVAIGWIFSKENFFKNTSSWLSFGKLRASYGLAGSDQIGNYKYLPTYNPLGSNTYLGVGLIQPNGLPNPQYGWEKTKTFEAGLELGFMKDRITFTGSYIRSQSSTLLIPYLLPTLTGGSSVMENFPAVIGNSDVEFTIGSTNIKRKNFSWSTNFNLTVPIYLNKLIAFPGLATSTYANSYVIGKSTDIYKMYHYTGVDKQTGLYTFYDYDHDGAITYPNDLKTFVYTGRQFYGGINNSFNYKGLQVDVFFQFVERKHTASLQANSGMPGVMTNMPYSIYARRWQKPGDNATVQKLFISSDAGSTAFYNYTNSDAAYGSNGSFVRLKTLSISYTLPDRLVRSAHLNNVRMYVRGQNLFVITPYEGLDPENQGYAIPPLAILTVGFHVDL